MSNYEKLLAGLNTCAGRGNSCAGCSYHCGTAKCVKALIGDAADELERQRAEIDRLTAENRAKEQYIAEHMGGTAERYAQMRRDAERLRGTTAHANSDEGILLEEKYR